MATESVKNTGTPLFLDSQYVTWNLDIGFMPHILLIGRGVWHQHETSLDKESQQTFYLTTPLGPHTSAS